MFHLLKTDPEVDLEVEALRAGDYIVDGHVLVERKTVSDLTTSIYSGRLFRQAHKLRHERPRRISMLVVEHQGKFRGLETGPAVGARLTLALSYGVPSIVVGTAEQFVWVLKQIARHLNRTNTRAYIEPLSHSRRRVSTAQRMLAQVPGLGTRKATRVLQYFGSLRSVAEASHQDLTQVPGLGAKLAERILQALNGET